jgi:hypothetical protein
MHSSTTTLPMYPAPPVTRMFIMYSAKLYLSIPFWLT